MKHLVQALAIFAGITWLYLYVVTRWDPVIGANRPR